MNERRSAAARLRSLRHWRTKLRAEVERSIYPAGMTVGMPKVAVDSGTLVNILDTLDACEAEITERDDG